MNLGNAGHVDELQSQLLSLLFVINTEHALTTVNIQHAAIQVSDLVMMDTPLGILCPKSSNHPSLRNQEQYVKQLGFVRGGHAPDD